MFGVCKKEEVYRCKTCNKEFFNHGSYVNHIKNCTCYRIVENNNQKKSSCVIL